MWRCINRFDQCNASNTINVIESTIVRASEHVCLSHHEQNVRDVVMDTCKHPARKQYAKLSPARKVYEEAVVEIHEVDADFTMYSYEEKKKHVT